MSKTSLKGAAFEYFVRKVLLSSGFKSVLSDGFLIYDAGTGQMLHGLGQPHNVDVLVEPHIQTPFYNLSRLIVECKCYSEPLGIEYVRNVLGLRVDINNFDIVTPDILKNRKSYRGKKERLYPFERYNYQVALASFNGFKESAQSLAATHKVPLISFSSSTFESIRNIIFALDELELNDNEYAQLDLFFHEKEYSLADYRRFDNTTKVVRWHNGFLEEINSLLCHLCVGITNSGAILFLYKVSNMPKGEYNDGYELRWDSSHKYWFLRGYHDDNQYVFELPEVLIDEWSNAAENMDKRDVALNLKERMMSNIVLYKTENGRSVIKILNLSNEFIMAARRRLNDE